MRGAIPQRDWPKSSSIFIILLKKGSFQDEAIDELAEFLGVGEAVANVTRQAMNGNARFRWVCPPSCSYEETQKIVTEVNPKMLN